jgi:two-component system, OmpR family, response regulator MprA
VTGGRILVVDDDIMVRDSVGQVLEEEGYDVEYATDGRDALGKVQDDPPDAILLDVMMPGMNGRQFLQALRDDLGHADIPVVVMTAVQGIDAHRAYALGATDLVEKPFDVDQLLNKVALALFRAREYETIPERPPTRRSDLPGGAASEPGGVVLVLDHDRSSLRRMDKLLSDRGYTVVTLSRVSEELPRLARVLEPRAILLDLRLPEIDGLTALRWLRAERSLDAVPILVFSGSVDDLERVRSEIVDLAAETAPAPLDDDQLVEFLSAPPASASRGLA